MQGQRVLWLTAVLALTSISARAEEPAADEPPEAESSTVAGMARTDAMQPDAELGRSGSAGAEDRSEETPAAAEAASQGAPVTVITASATTGLDAGPAVMLRCLGADGVFSFGPGSDDFVAWAFSPGPIDLTQPYGLHYRFGVVPPVGEQCRIFREPFPAGVVPPSPPPPPAP